MMRHAVSLPACVPFNGDWLMAFLGRRALPGIEEMIPGGYRRSLALSHGGAVMDVIPRTDRVEATFVLDDERDLDAAAAACRRLLDLDRDLSPVDAQLGRDPVVGSLVRAAPGRRVPGHHDGRELAVRAVLGQQISVTAATRLATRLAGELAVPLSQPVGAVTHLFPDAGAIAALDPARLPMPRSRGRTLVGLAAALAEGRLVIDASAPAATIVAELLAIRGIGPWTAGYIAMRALGDPDAFMPGDAGLRHGLAALGHEHHPAALRRLSDAWRPYRAYAIQHLWALVA